MIKIITVKRPIILLVMALFVFMAFAPVNYAKADAVDDIVDDIIGQLQEIYTYMDDYDKDNIRDARAALQNFAADPASDWDAVLGVGTDNNLLTNAVIGCFVDEEAARAAVKSLFASTGEIYYSTDAAGLRSVIDDYKNAYRDEFQALFGTDISMDELFGLFSDARTALPGVINETEAGLLANDTNEDLIAAMPEYLKRAMNEALDDNPAFSGRLAAIGWSADKLIAQQEVLAGLIDASGKARLSLALAAIRTETKLAAMPTNLQVGDKPAYTVKIMGRSATSFVAWASNAPGIVEVDNDPHGNFVIEAKAPGTAQLIVYRDYEGADPAHDWLLKFTVTVEGGTILYGDVNDDGEVNATDLVLVARNIVNTYDFSAGQMIAADVDRSNIIDVSDYVLIARFIVGALPELPVVGP